MSDNGEIMPPGWVSHPIEHLLAPLANGQRLHHGWSPQCDKEPADDGEWGVLKTTAVQDGAFLAEHNKRLPAKLKPKPQFEVQKGDLLITCAGPRVRCGVPCLVRETRSRLILSGKMYRFRTRPEYVESGYMEAYLRSPETQRLIDKMKTGISDSGLNLTHGRFFTLQVPVAPLPEQRRIVAKIEELFSDLDAGVAALERVRANLKRYRAAVLKAAVEGRLTEEWRKRNPVAPEDTAAKLHERILLGRRAKWEQDQLGKFKEAGKTPPKGWKEKYKLPVNPDVEFLPTAPKGWAVASVDQLTTIITSGSRDWTQYYGRGTGTFVMAQNVRPGRLDLSSRTVVDPPEGDRDSERSQVECDDLLVTIVGANTGDVCRVPENLPEHYVCQSVALMRPVLSAVSEYVEWYLVSDENGRKQFDRYIYGQGRPHLGFDQIRMTAVLLPPLAEQSAIVAEVDRRLSVADAAEQQVEHALQRAARLRQSILKRAFEGRLVANEANQLGDNALMDSVPTVSTERPVTAHRPNAQSAGATR